LDIEPEPSRHDAEEVVAEDFLNFVHIVTILMGLTFVQ
jgi:hypothetical protein